MTSERQVLILTMPGFGITTLRHLAALPALQALAVHVALVGVEPPAWRRLGAWLRFHGRARADRIHRDADGTLSAAAAQRWLRGAAFPWCWAADDDHVRTLRQRLQPGLTLTITSRILFSARTLADPATAWFNVHPGLLPDYAGASPAPYMYFEGVGGCTIHRMAPRVDAGAIVDLAPMGADLGRDVGEYFFERLPAHTAHRVAALVERWRTGAAIADLPMSARPLRACSSARLAKDRQLDWRWHAHRLAHWVRSLAAIAPAWWIGPSGRRVEVMEGRAIPAASGSPHGTVLNRHGRWIHVACGEGGAVALRCRCPPRVAPGQRLMAVPEATGTKA